jgi:hypothetical protein
MREIGTIIGGMGTLIFVYLILSNYGASTSIISGVSGSAVNLIGALQGKSASGLSLGA